MSFLYIYFKTVYVKSKFTTILNSLGIVVDHVYQINFNFKILIIKTKVRFMRYADADRQTS